MTNNLTIHFDNVDFNSTTGPNRFAFRLADNLSKRGHMISPVVQCSSVDVQLSCIQMGQKRAPTALRLDGIYFNLDQDWEKMNEPIRWSYENADAVIVQSLFNRELTRRYFGEHPNVHVVHNGTDLNHIASIEPMQSKVLDGYDDVWVCASSWRPHKRLEDNIRYFQEKAPKGTCLLVAGKIGYDIGPGFDNLKDVYYAGVLHPNELIALYKRASHFLHLAFLDHCPNVVINARAAGCKIVCASSGGTYEIAGRDAIVVKDLEWDLEPLMLYNPPELDFNETVNIGLDSVLDINHVANQYLNVFRIIK